MLRFWERLHTIKQFSLHAAYGEGRGEVLVIQESPSTLVFEERGTWLHSGMSFRNVLRWRLDRMTGRVSLEHLRLGTPVFLVDLGAPEPHFCGEDTYRVEVISGEDPLILRWKVQGPRKNEVMEFRYFQ